MINCVHPEHFEATLAAGGAWVARLRGIRANASRRSHAELDAAPDLDAGDPVELGGQYRALVKRHNHFNVFGGCCGTDHRHVEQIAFACTWRGSDSPSRIPHLSPIEAFDIGGDVGDLAARQIHVRHFGMRIGEETP